MQLLKSVYVFKYSCVKSYVLPMRKSAVRLEFPLPTFARAICRTMFITKPGTSSEVENKPLRTDSKGQNVNVELSLVILL